MGKGHKSSSKTKSTQTLEHRELNADEKALIAQQAAYMAQLKPISEQLLERADNTLYGVYHPNWANVHDDYQDALHQADVGYNNLQHYTTDIDNMAQYYGNRIDNISDTEAQQMQGLQKYQDQLDTISNGNLPQSYLNAMNQTYNQLYKTSMGNSLSNLASRGIINSSTLNNSINQIQKNLSNQMANDFRTNLDNASQLTTNAMNQRYNTIHNTAANQISNLQAANSLKANGMTNAFNMGNTLIGNQKKNAEDRYNSFATTQQNSTYLPNQYLQMANANSTANNNAINTVSNVYDNASWIKTVSNTNTH